MSEDMKVTLVLSEAEALVLFELLTRWEATGQNTIIIEHQAEQRMLWDIQAMLEKQLVAPFSPDYLAILSAAREVVQDKQQ